MTNKWDIDLSREHKTGCPRCIRRGLDKSKNNLHVYGEDKGAFCFSCSFSIPSKGHREAMGWDNIDEELEDEEVSTKELITKEELDKLKSYTGVAGGNARNIPDEVYKAYACRFKYSEETGEVVETLYPYTEGYAAAGYKVRIMSPKDFRSLGKIGKDSELFGQWKWKSGGGKYLLLASGEADCLAAYTMLENYRTGRGSDFDPIPCVSSAIGEAGAWKQVQAQYEWINTFERVVVVPDQDEAGLKALKKLSEVIPKGKMFVCTLPSKDINKMLDDGKQKQFIRCFYDAKPYSPDGIVGSASAPARARTEAATPKIPLPPFMHKVQKMMAGGIPLGRITNLGSASGTGKSTIIDEIVYYLIFNSPHKLGIVSLESDVGQYHLKLLSRHVGRKIDLIESVEEKLAYLDTPEVLAKEKELVENDDGSHRYFILDERDGGLESLKSLISQLVVQCDCKVIILDPLQDALDGCSLEDQALFSKWLKGMVKSHNCTFLNINHTRKTSQGGKQGSQGADLSEEDYMGSSTIFKSAACNLLFSRNKEADNDLEKNTTFMKMSKCRWTGSTGLAGEYYYDNQTHTMYDKDDWVEKNPVAF